MEILNPSVIWLSIGILLIALEIFTGTFYLLLVGSSALLTSILCYFITTNPPTQIILFGVFSSISIFTLRGRLKSKGNSIPPPDEFEFVTVTENIPPNGEGFVQYQGAPWSAINQSEETIYSQSRAVVVKTQGNKLIIKSKNN